MFTSFPSTSIFFIAFLICLGISFVPIASFSSIADKDVSNVNLALNASGWLTDLIESSGFHGVPNVL